MCSRECYSVSLGGLIAALLVFLAAFLVGVAVVDGIETALLPDAQINRLRNGLGPIDIKGRVPRQDIESLGVEFKETSPAVEGMAFEERFEVTNLSSQTIYFESSNNEVASENEKGVPNRKPNGMRVFSGYVTKRQLNPGDSASLFVRIPILAANDFEFSVDYTVGDRRVHRSTIVRAPDIEKYYRQDR